MTLKIQSRGNVVRCFLSGRNPIAVLLVYNQTITSAIARSSNCGTKHVLTSSFKMYYQRIIVKTQLLENGIDGTYLFLSGSDLPKKHPVQILWSRQVYFCVIRQKPMVFANCAKLQLTLLEVNLFYHKCHSKFYILFR